MIIALLRLQGLKIFHYLDDRLLLAECPWVLQEHFQTALRVLQSFGWLINFEKSHLQPTLVLEYPVFVFDTVMGKIFFASAEDSAASVSNLGGHGLSCPPGQVLHAPFGADGVNAGGDLGTMAFQGVSCPDGTESP